jgi:hypothetical protein
MDSSKTVLTSHLKLSFSYLPISIKRKRQTG